MPEQSEHLQEVPTMRRLRGWAASADAELAQLEGGADAPRFLDAFGAATVDMIGAPTLYNEVVFWRNLQDCRR